MQARSVSSSIQAVAAGQTNAGLVVALVMGIAALGLHLWMPANPWLTGPVQNVLHALSLVIIAVLISGRYRWSQRAGREDAARERQLQAMLSMFMVVKHELHNDMQVVMGNAELASMMLENGGAARKPVENINEAAALAIDRIQQLSVFSASMRTAPAAVDINALLRETTARLTTEVPASVTLRLELAALPSRVLVDRNLLSLSLSYLIRLAVKTLSHGGEIVVRTHSSNAQLGDKLITATLDIFILRDAAGSDGEASRNTLERRQAKFERILEEARNTTQALVERSGASVLMRPFGEGQESLIKIGFVTANVGSSLKESVIVDES